MQNTDVLGSLVLAEDGSVLSSTGQLSNMERLSQVFINVIRLATSFHSSDDGIKDSDFKRVSIFWNDFVYVVTASNRRVHVMKRLLPNENYEFPPQILHVDA